MKPVNIPGERLFPVHFRVFGLGILLAGVLVSILQGRHFLGAVLVIAGLGLLTSSEGLLINSKAKVIKTYYQILGLKISKSYSFESLSFIKLK